MNGNEIGIHIRAKAHLEEVEKAGRDLEKFGGSSVKASRMVKLLTQSLKEGSETDIDKLGKRISALQKRIEDPGLGQKQQKLIKDEISGIQSKIKELKQLQKIKADDYGSMEQETHLLLDQLKAKRFLTNAEKEHIKTIEEGLRYLEKFNKAKLDLEQTRMGKIQEDWKAQQEQAAKAGLGEIGARGGRFVRRAAGLVIGGTLLGVAIQSMKKWAEVDTAIMKTRASLGGLRKEEVEAFVEIGNRFGYLKKETLEYLDILTRISGKREETTFGRLIGYGRAMGVGAQALQMREIQRWGGEGITMGGRQGNVFLGQFTKMAELLRMREGRMGEFIDVGINLTKTMERTFLSVGGQDILRNIMLPAMIWGGEDRGRGMRGFSFMQRMQGALTDPNDIMNLMLYRTIGVPQTYEQMWKMRRVREQGVLATFEGMPLLTGIVDQFSKMFGGDKYRVMGAMKAAMPEMSAIEIQRMVETREKVRKGEYEIETGKISEDLKNKLVDAGIEAEHIKTDKIIKINEDYFKILMTQFPEMTKDWKGIGEKFVSEGEKWRIAVENMQVGVGRFGETVIPILTKTADYVEKISDLLYKRLGIEKTDEEKINVVKKELGIKGEMSKELESAIQDMQKSSYLGGFSDWLRVIKLGGQERIKGEKGKELENTIQNMQKSSYLGGFFDWLNVIKSTAKNIEIEETSEVDKLRTELVENIISENRQGWKSRISDELTEMKVNNLVISNVKGLEIPQQNITYYQQITVEGGSDTLRYIEKHPETGIPINIGATDNE